MTDLTARLRDDLGAALRRRDRPTVKTLRTVLSAIANAEAVPVSAPAFGGAPLEEGPIAGAATGLGAAEAERRVLTDDDVRDIVAGEQSELLAAAEMMAERTPERASEMRAAAELLASYL